MHAWNCTDPRHGTKLFGKQHGQCIVYITMVLGQPASRLSKEVCWYADADWLKLLVNETVARGQLLSLFRSILNNLTLDSYLWVCSNVAYLLRRCKIMVLCANRFETKG